MEGDWKDVLNDCRASVNKEPLDKEPSDQFKSSILMAEHSPIRNLHIRWQWPNIPSWCATHWVRHMWYSLVSTQRPDKTGKKRGDADAPVTFIGEANPQNLIDSWRKRLCFQAAPLTREYAEDFKWVSYQKEPHISRVLVPNCIYRGGCPESKPCGFYDLFVKTYGQTSDLPLRYKQYEESFLKQRLAQHKKEEQDG